MLKTRKYEKIRSSPNAGLENEIYDYVQSLTNFLVKFSQGLCPVKTRLKRLTAPW